LRDSITSATTPRTKHKARKACPQVARDTGRPRRNKHWKRSSPSPRAQRESPAGPNVPCERRTDPAEPHHHDTPVNDSYFSSWATITPHRGTGSQSTQRQRDRAGASIGTSTPCPPSRDSAKAQPAPTFPASAGPVPRRPPKTAAERDRTEASTGSDQALPLAHSAKAGPSPSFPASEGSVPRSPQKSQRSGIGPTHALEAIKPFPSRTARKLILPRAYLRASDRSRGALLLILLASPQPSR
jgi:hypothetical protein